MLGDGWECSKPEMDMREVVHICDADVRFRPA
jgi:hypothetical protein